MLAADKMIAALQACRRQSCTTRWCRQPTPWPRPASLPAAASKPVVICDAQDNPGAGATGDTTGVLAALVDGGRKRPSSACCGILTRRASPMPPVKVPKSMCASAASSHELGTGPFKARVRVEAVVGRRVHLHRTNVRRGASQSRADGGTQGAGQGLRRDGGGRVTNRTQNADQAIFTHLWSQPARQARSWLRQVGGAFPGRL
jgi:microcystin degradation protein MlrC